MQVIASVLAFFDAILKKFLLSQFQYLLEVDEASGESVLEIWLALTGTEHDPQFEDGAPEDSGVWESMIDFQNEAQERRRIQ